MEPDISAEHSSCAITPHSPDQFDQNFKPKGAIAFFVLLVILGLIIWFGIYFLMLKRA